MGGGCGDILGVAAVIEPSHATHQGDGEASWLERAVRRIIDDADTLCTQHTWKTDLWIVSAARIDLRAAESNRLDADADPSRRRLRERRLLDLQRLRASGLADDGSAQYVSPFHRYGNPMRRIDGLTSIRACLSQANCSYDCHTPLRFTELPLNGPPHPDC